MITSALALATPGCDFAQSRFSWTSLIVEALQRMYPLPGSVNVTVDFGPSTLLYDPSNADIYPTNIVLNTVMVVSTSSSSVSSSASTAQSQSSQLSTSTSSKSSSTALPFSYPGVVAIDAVVMLVLATLLKRQQSPKAEL